MASIFRSEDMSLVQVYIPSEIAQATVAELGETGLMQFKDLNGDENAFNRAFVGEIRRLEEMERKLRFLESQVDKEKLDKKPNDDSVPYGRVRSQQMVDELEATVNDYDARINQMNTYQEGLNKRMLELTELRHVLKEASGFFADAEANPDLIEAQTQANAALAAGGAGIVPLRSETSVNPLLSAEEAGAAAESSKLEFVAGVIPSAKMGVFERILWRVLRGNLYMNSAPIEEQIRDPVTDELVQKNVFVIFAHGKEVLTKIRKISESLGATLYPVDENAAKRREDALECQARIDDLNSVLYNTNQTRRAELLKLADNIQTWNTMVKKEKAIYAAMNTFNYDGNRKTLIAEGWVPDYGIPVLQQSLRDVAERTTATVPPFLSVIETSERPPTHFRLNKFTKGFHQIIAAYGIARYKEVNPGLFTIITFPFLFAIMFGDIGHGIFMALIAVLICWYEKPLKKYAADEMFGMIYAGRYIILLMAFFSIYVGMVYNDILSLGLEFYGSGWEFWPPYPPEHNATETRRLFARAETNYPQRGFQTKVYPFGVDPAWVWASNKLLFLNSYKMKQAILLGVIHMSFGTCLQVANHIKFKNWVSIVFEFIPQILFFWLIFGYLGFMIVYKWCTDWYSQGLPPPNLLNTLIYMFLSPGRVDEPLYAQGTKLQSTLQVAFLIIALVSVPIMLLPKPFILKAQHDRKVKAAKAAGGAAHAPVSIEDGNGAVAEAAQDVDAVTQAHPTVDAAAPPLNEVVVNGESSTKDALAKAEPPRLSKDLTGVKAAPTDTELMENSETALVQAHHEDHVDHFDFGEVMIYQVIHTIEYCLGCVSNTASYLRLWALSLAHAQLSEVLYNMTLQTMFKLDPGFLQVIAIFGGFVAWFTLTIGILLIMEGLSAFLHALRLHWVEFNNKFYEGSGREFIPFAFSRINKMDDIVVPDTPGFAIGGH
ncbi:V-type ATPase, V0 complex, 116kDa subunit family [Hyaloraphidium curvatum]|nr:V-type ATPase, V0 complex, 116kDa subunit family [Hyaloraphidium curvatum]KAI9026950.1 V-type ATPase, V0 complex, 116kDa subunit family [Hyaloraphidium curvatum]